MLIVEAVFKIKRKRYVVQPLEIHTLHLIKTFEETIRPSNHFYMLHYMHYYILFEIRFLWNISLLLRNKFLYSILSSYYIIFYFLHYPFVNVVQINNIKKFISYRHYIKKATQLFGMTFSSTTFPFLTIFLIFQLSFESNVKTVILLGA